MTAPLITQESQIDEKAFDKACEAFTLKRSPGPGNERASLPDALRAAILAYSQHRSVSEEEIERGARCLARGWIVRNACGRKIDVEATVNRHWLEYADEAHACLEAARGGE